MTGHSPTPDPANRRLDNWLIRNVGDLDEKLADHLDFETGLRDARLPDRAETLDEALLPVLDLDTGLRAVTPSQRPSTDAPPSDQNTIDPDDSPLTSLHATAAQLSPQERLGLRTQFIPSSLTAIKECACFQIIHLQLGDIFNLLNEHIQESEMLIHTLRTRPPAQQAVTQVRAWARKVTEALVTVLDVAQPNANYDNWPEVDQGLPPEFLRYRSLQSWSRYRPWARYEPALPDSRGATPIEKLVGGIKTSLEDVNRILPLAEDGISTEYAALGSDILLMRTQETAGNLRLIPFLLETTQATYTRYLKQLARSSSRSTNARERAFIRRFSRAVHQSVDRGDATQLTEIINVVASTLTDFTDADLSDQEMEGVDLRGVQWSILTTRWPPGWREPILRVSAPIQPGPNPELYEVHGIPPVRPQAWTSDRS